jgi:DnaJ-class molecular chaperone
MPETPGREVRVMARKTTARPAKPAAVAEPVPEECPTCKGTGTVAVTVHVGRRHRIVGQQDGMCLACFGTGTT